jgi:RimJ/RimL family protein N-acetyltransferase
VTAPILETERLILRAHRLEDFDALHIMWTDPLVHKHILPEPPSREQNWNRLIRYAGHWPMLGYGFWAATEKSTDSIVGELGYADFHRDIDPPLGDRIEMGWVFASAYHGKGFASEALTAVIGWGDRNLKHKNTACMIDPQNLASIRIAGKFGFQKSYETTYHGDPTWVFYRDQPA